MMLPNELNVFLKLTDAVVITNINHHVLAVNEAYTRLTGYSIDEIIGKKAGQLRTKYTPKSMYTEMKDSLQKQEGWLGVFTNRKKSGEIWSSSISITPFEIGGNTYYVGIFRKLEELKRGQYLNEQRVVQIQSALLRVLAISSEIRDPGIEEHLIRVQDMTNLLLNNYVKQNNVLFCESQIKSIVNASILHDIGKSAIPEGILYKPGPLAKHERKIIEMHTNMGIDIFEKIYVELDDELISQEYNYARNIIMYHHEKFDGTGYPERLKGYAIPLEARVVSVVDVFDALTTKRPYKDRWTQQQAINYIIDEKGKHFDPDLVEAFVKLYEEGALEKYEYKQHYV